ncbi:hypothetical protein V7S43_009788 [Phytophthora oleae]|uniref:BZIP domain-containing protein n=1 Tax=Phytophthora oleae TaxID=2107226 RepID=A0ABD3FFS9_9STRA
MSTTCPPNSQNLTEEVIGNALQRMWPPHRSFMADLIYLGTDETDTAQHSNTGLSCQSKKRTRSTKPEDSVRKGKKIKSDDAELEAYHRERRRRNQERYRLRQRKLIEDLDEAIQKLRDEIERLSGQRNSLLCGVSTKETMWSVAAEYFRVFQHGLLATDGLPVAELDFLKATMAADLNANTVYGFEALARNWKVFTLSFKDVQRLDQLEDDSLLATTTGHLRLPSLPRSAQRYTRFWAPKLILMTSSRYIGSSLKYFTTLFQTLKLEESKQWTSHVCRLYSV